MNKQLDFRLEAANYRLFRAHFESNPHVVFPALVEQLCSDRVLTMEFINGVKEDKIRAIGDDPSFVARKGLEIVARMTLEIGVVHADLHPGNILFLPGNRIALLDVGLVGRSDDEGRRRFARLSFYLACGMGPEVARVFYESSERMGDLDYPAYEHEITEVLAGLQDRPFDEINVTARLPHLYRVLRRHHLRVDPSLTMPSIAVMASIKTTAPGPQARPVSAQREHSASASSFGGRMRPSTSCVGAVRGAASDQGGRKGRWAERWSRRDQFVSD